MFSTRWQMQPFRDLWTEMNRLQEEMNRVFGRTGGNGYRMGVYPPLDLWQDEENLYVEAELPGMDLADLEIYVTGGNQLSVRGERKRPEIPGGNWHRQERNFGAFSRLVELPQDVDEDKVEAELRNGVLTIKLPKREEAKPRKISVKSN
ncbi:MAG: Hsp20/alpha crystallin family protein [Pirellulales bacterium]|nr:Hsp20/alpha crystallin family protein [Pirellulales bacterium]